MDKMLEIKALSVSYGENTILNNFCLEVYRGETVCIMGRTGIGKTSVLRAVAGVLPPDASMKGEILIDGVRVDTMTCKQRADYLRGRVGIMLQDSKTSLDPTVTVFKQLRETIPSGDRGEVLNWLTKVGFSDPAYVAHRRPHELSGGMLQRVCLAMAMASGFDLLILDEPFSQVDPKTKQQLTEIVLAWQKQHHTAVLIITHDEKSTICCGSRTIMME